MQALWYGTLGTYQWWVLKWAQMLLVWWQAFNICDSASHYIQFLINGSMLALIHSGTSLFGICSGRLTLV